MFRAVRILIVICCLLIAADSVYSQPYDTLLVFFPLDKTNFTEASSKFLDSIVAHNVLKHGESIRLFGHGDYLGSDDYNKNLSYMRAKNVQDYLVLSGFNRDDIKLIIGKGKINRPGATDRLGNPVDRKVEMVINKIVDTPEEQKFRYYFERTQINETMPLRNIEFYRGSVRVTPESMPELLRLIAWMMEHPSYRIRLEGHICCLGPGLGQDEPYDESTLSEKRARSIRDSLIVHGIDTARLQCIGMGNSYPVVYPEESDEDGRRNRRVEVRVLEK